MKKSDLKICDILLVSYTKPNLAEGLISFGETPDITAQGKFIPEHSTNIVQLSFPQMVIEAETNGVKENPLRPYLTPSFTIGVLTPIIPFTLEQQAKIIAVWKSHIGNKYGFQDIAWLAALDIARKLDLPSVRRFDPLADSDMPICSELSAMGWSAVVPEMFKGWDLGDIQPSDLPRMPGTRFEMLELNNVNVS